MSARLMGEAERRIGYIRAAAGDGFADLELESAASFVEVTDDARSVLERASPGLRHADPKLLADHPNVLVGSIAEMVDCLERRRERLGLSYISVNGKDAVAFAPVVARLSGR